MKLAGWGRYPQVETEMVRPRDDRQLREAMTHVPLIARGNGRGYGDCAVSPGCTIDVKAMNRLLAFDPNSGVLVTEAGVLLSDIIDCFLPRGWFPCVTPGTRFVTVGGMIAADVHGKNHHRDGSIARFIEWIEVMDADGSITRCSSSDATDLFSLTVGGMGLTGIIVKAAMRLRRVETGWVRQTSIVAEDLEETFQFIDAHSDYLYSAAWIDCLSGQKKLGRSILFLGEHADLAELGEKQELDRFALNNTSRLSVPFDLPGWSLNSVSVRAFNALYYWKGKRDAGESLVGWKPFFYPLDSIIGWNRIYGRKGFLQFQCVFPQERSYAGVRALVEATSKAGLGSFLAVLKRFGKQESVYSFPMEGYTLALDFAFSPGTLQFLERLDRIVIDYGGRFYLAKDARMSRETLQATDARTPAFREARLRNGWSGKFASAQSVRLDL